MFNLDDRAITTPVGRDRGGAATTGNRRKHLGDSRSSRRQGNEAQFYVRHSRKPSKATVVKANISFTYLPDLLKQTSANTVEINSGH